MSDTKAMRDKRMKLILDARAILEKAKAENRALLADEASKYDAMMADVDSLKSTIDRIEGAPREDHREAPGAGALQRGTLFGVELRGLVGGSGSGATLVPVEYGRQVWDRLAPQSVGLASGFTVVETQSASLKFPKITGDVSAAWTAEAATISNSDASMSQVTATPKKLAALETVSNELIRDSEPAVIDVIGANMTRSLALKLDLGFFEGSGTGAEITGLKNVAGIGSVSMGTNGLTPVNLDPFADAIGTLLQANANPTAMVMHPRTWQTLTKIKETTSSNNKPLLQESSGSGSQPVRREIYGVPVFLTSQLSITETQGTATNASSAYVYQADQVLFVRRHDVEVMVDGSRLFNSDQSEIRAILRCDMVVPNAASVVRISGILP